MKLCPACQRKQYIQKSICICGFVSYEDSLTDENKQIHRLSQLKKVIESIAKTKRLHYLIQAQTTWLTFIKHHKRLERKAAYVSVHSTYQSRKKEIGAFLIHRKKDQEHHHKAGRYNPFLSIREKANQFGYLSELAIGLQHQKKQLVQQDLKEIKKEYIKRSSFGKKISGTKAGTMLSPLDLERSRQIVQNKPLVCASRHINISSADTIEEAVSLLKNENDMLIAKRMIKNRKLKKSQTRADLKRDRALQKIREAKTKERLRIEMENAHSAHEKKRMVCQRAFATISKLFESYESSILDRSFQLFWQRTRNVEDCSKEARRAKEIDSAKYHQSVVGKARRLRQLVAENAV